MKRVIFFPLFIFFASLSATAQNKIVKYYANDWSPTTQEKATYYAEFVKQGDLYQCTSYWLPSNAVRGKSMYPDTIMAGPRGLQVLYAKNGNLEDSSFYDKDGKPKFSYHYHPNKKLAASYVVPENGGAPVIEGFDEMGNKIKNYIYAKEAEFRGGDKAWQKYLANNLSKEFFAKDDTEQKVDVHVQFIVDENGYVIRPKVIRSSGLKYIDADAIRVVMSSPPWNPGIMYNKPFKAYRVQPITYMLYPQKKK